VRRATRKIKGSNDPSTPSVVGDPFNAGIELVGVWMTECSFKDFGFNRTVQEGDQHGEAGGDQLDVEHECEVWFDEQATEAIVRLTVGVKPETQPTFEAKVSYVGYYRATANPTVTLQSFAWNNGLAYLVPFVREKLAALTQASHYQPLYLQPFNLTALTEGESANRSALADSMVQTGKAETP
jgi:preprotein translocase subunit SecB